MFDLEQAIADWRQNMLAAGIQAPVPLEELESHLRDDIEQQLHRDVSASAAFAAAVEQLGGAKILRQEFKPNRLDIRFLSPIYMHLYCFLAAPLVLSMIWASFETISGGLPVSGLVALLIALYIGSLPFFYRRLFTRQIRLMRVILRAGYWFVWTWTTLALLSTTGLIQIGNAVGMVGWSVYAATFATLLAGANYEREHVKTQTAKLTAS